MMCPMKFSQGVDSYIGASDYMKCHQADCAWWNERFEKCSVAVDSYLKGIEHRRQEAKENVQWNIRWK